MVPVKGHLAFLDLNKEIAPWLNVERNERAEAMACSRNLLERPKKPNGNWRYSRNEYGTSKTKFKNK